MLINIGFNNILKYTVNIPKNSSETDLKTLAKDVQSESEDNDTGETSKAIGTKTEITIVRIPSLWLKYQTNVHRSAPVEREMENVNVEEDDTRL